MVKSPFLLLNPQFYLMFKAIWTHPSPEDVADVERVAREIHILKLVQHPHIIQLYEIIETPRQLWLARKLGPRGPHFVVEIFSCPTKSQNTQHVSSVDIFGFQFQYIYIHNYIYIYSYIHIRTYMYVCTHTDPLAIQCGRDHSLNRTTIYTWRIFQCQVR